MSSSASSTPATLADDPILLDMESSTEEMKDACDSELVQLVSVLRSENTRLKVELESKALSDSYHFRRSEQLARLEVEKREHIAKIAREESEQTANAVIKVTLCTIAGLYAFLFGITRLNH